MTKAEAVQYMIKKVEEIERQRLAENLSIDATKQKKETVNAIYEALKGVQIDEDQEN